MEYEFELRNKVNTINCVYEIKNVINQKVYIGSSFNLKKRMIDHYNLLFTNKHHSIKLQRAWNKYGSHNFRFLILEENIDTGLILKREQHYIDLFQSQKKGYNVLPKL
jgi:group I intron endonuclease